jgi:hypothetical protein
MDIRDSKRSRGAKSSTLPAVAQAGESQIWVRRAAVILAAVLVAVVAFILISRGDDNSGSGSKNVVSADAAKVRELAAEQDHPIYWAGPAGAHTVEWTDLPDGRVYLRYLTGGAEIGDPRPQFLTVGTYPVGNGVAALRKADKIPGSRTFSVGGGGIALVNRNGPTSVYLAYPGSKYQIEVFDPDPQRALELVTSEEIRPVH